VANKKTSLLLLSSLLFSQSPLYASDTPSAQVSSEIANDEAYQQMNKEFELILKAAQDVGQKECKSDAPQGEIIRSAYLWLNKGKLLSDNERVRFQVYQSEVAKIKKRLQEILDSKDSARIQAEGVLLQSDLFTTEINFLWGNHGRIEARTQFLVEIKDGSAAAKYEDKLWLDSFEKDLTAGLNKSLSIASSACELKDDDKVEGCEEAKAKIQHALSLIPTYKEKYSQKNLPSQKVKDDLLAEEEKLRSAINAIPSGVQDFAWKTPAVNGFEKIVEVRKKVTVYCPESKDSKSQDKSVKIAEIFEDKNKTSEQKQTEMKKVDESLANSLLGGGLIVEDLKKIPTEWNRQNLMMGLGAHRDPLMAEVTKKLEALIAEDKKKVELIREKRKKLFKIIMALGDMNKYKLNVADECGGDPNPGVYVCPGRTPNPLCDPNSNESFNKANYNACRYRVEQQNEMITKLANADASLKSNPDVIGVESYYLGTVGPLWRAIVKKPDGTIGYEPLVKGPSQNYGGTFGGVQNDPRNKPPTPTPTPTDKPSTSGGTGSSGGSSGGGSSPSSGSGTSAANSKPSEECKAVGNKSTSLLPSEIESAKKSYIEKLSSTGVAKRVALTATCGSSPVKLVQKEDSVLYECKLKGEKIKTSSRIEYEGCKQAVSEFNKLVSSGKLILNSEDQKTYDKYAKALSAKGDKTRAKSIDVCGSSPCKTVTTGANSNCTIDESDKPKLKEYNLCQNAVNDYNGKLDAAINLSSYLKNHPDFVEIVKHPDTGLWVAKMKSNGQFKYLPLNYTE
jgi:hypothetical protein